MKLLRSLLRKGSVSFHYAHQRRGKSTRAIEKSVVVSESHDIYTNLALEDWFYRNCDFNNKHMLMLWTNTPCVVIGKFQNPWLECNVPGLSTLIPEGVKLARRNSGGGTVYHDLGNLNLTFFTPRGDYNRKRNLETITKAIFRRFGLRIDISSREDLVYGQFKVSGTAAKLGRTVAYHHCTLLVNANKGVLSKSLRKPGYIIKTNATQSIRSPIKNLREIDRELNIDELLEWVANEYLSAVPYVKGSFDTSVSSNGNIDYVTPSEYLYPGICDIRDELKSSGWVFGKCPKFSAEKKISLENNTARTVRFKIERGVICGIELQTESNAFSFDLYLEQFRDRKFDESMFDEIGDLLNSELMNVKLEI